MPLLHVLQFYSILSYFILLLFLIQIRVISRAIARPTVTSRYPPNPIVSTYRKSGVYFKDTILDMSVYVQKCMNCDVGKYECR